MKKSKIFLIAIVATFLGMSACEQVVELDVPNDDNILIVESRITNKLKYWKVQLTMSQPYFDQSDRNFVSDAEVVISSTHGTLDTLQYQDTGLYVSNTMKQCLVGESYTLTIKHGGKTYKATEKCNFQEPIDFLMSFELGERNGFIDPGYYVFEKAEENEGDGDFYWWRIFKNDSLVNNFGYILDSDEFRETSYFNINIDPDDPLKDMDKNILPRPFPFEFEPGDTVRVEQLNISKTYYNFIIEVQNQVSRSGTPFDSPPVNPRTNMSSGATGFFSVANVTESNLVVEE